MPQNDLPTDPVGSLAMHLALTVNMIQSGTPLSLLQQQLVTVRRKTAEVAELDHYGPDDYVQIEQPIPAGVAEALAEDIDIPDDLEGL